VTQTLHSRWYELMQTSHTRAPAEDPKQAGALPQLWHPVMFMSREGNIGWPGCGQHPNTSPNTLTAGSRNAPCTAPQWLSDGHFH
jgi:hypothetical protein